MGTEVHCNMYLPERCSMRELNENSRNSNWHLSQEKRTTQNGQCQDIVSIGAALNGYHGCDKEKLRDTILKHESILRHQVFELHRLYRRQWDLMNNLKNNVKEHALETKATRSSLFPSPSYSMVDQMRWPPSSSALVDPYSGLQLNSDSHFNHGKGKIMQSSFQESEVKLIGNSLNSNFKKVRRKLFGLELPTDEDSVNHVTEQKGSFNLTVEANSHPNAKKMSNCENSFPLVGKSSTHNGVPFCSDLHVKRNHGFLNLNEPFDHVEEADFPSSANCPLNNTCYQQKILQQGLCKYDHSDETRYHRYSIVGCRTAQDASILDPSQVETNIVTTSMPFVHEEGERKKRKIFGVEISESNQNASAASCVLDKKMCHSYDPEVNKTEPSYVSIGLNTGPLTSPYAGVTKEGLLVNCFSRSVLSLKDDVHTLHEKFHLSESSSNESQTYEAPISLRHVKCIKDITASEQFVEHDFRKTQMDRGCGVDELSLKDLNASAELQHKNQDPRNFAFEDRKDRAHEVVQRFRMMPHCNGLPSDEGEYLYQTNIEPLHEKFHKLDNKDIKLRKDPIENPIQDCSSVTIPHDARDKVRVNECSNERKIIGFHVYSESRSSKALASLDSTLKPHFLASTGIGNSTTNDSRKSDITDCMDPSCGDQYLMRISSGQGLVDKNVPRLTIDLNVSCDEETQSTVNSPFLKLGDKKDMEGPIAQKYGATCIGVEYMEEQNSSLADEALVKFAAESLVNISLSLADDHHDFSAAIETDASIDSLHWFAKVASSHKVDIQIATPDASLGKNKSDHNDCIPEELDDFEYMTLNLTETKIDAFCYRSPISLGENTNDGTTLPKRTRKGQTRRGRQQKKDFQRDILPRLASLSRNEVRDDILTIEEVVKSSGGCWQSSLTLKSRNAKGMGRKRSVASTPSTTATDEVCLLQCQQPITEDLVLQESSLTGWVKRTRRPRRLRYMVQNRSVAIK